MELVCMEQIVTFLHTLFTDDTGWLELCFIAGDPVAKPAPRLQRAAWRWYSPATQARIAAECQQLARRYGNVYLSATLYQTRQRSSAQALPSRVLFLDDAPSAPAVPYSLAVQTSAASQHAYYILDQAISPAERRALQRQLAAVLGSDPSGADVEQVVRVPESTNTKHGRNFPVTLIQHTTAPIALAWIDTAYGLGQATEPAAPAAPPAGVGHWYGNLGTLLGSDGLPRRIKHPRARALFREQWDDTSAQRAAVARSLVLHRYPDDEALALLLHFCTAGSERKGSDWLYQDCVRVLAKQRHALPQCHPEPTRSDASRPARTQPQRPPKSRARKDRPQQLDPDAFRQRLEPLLDSGDTVLMTRRQLAAALGLSLATLDRLEGALEACGEAKRFTAPSRCFSWLIVGHEAVQAAQQRLTTPAKLADRGVLNIALTPATQACAPPIASGDVEYTFQPIPMGQNAHQAPEFQITKEHTAPQGPPPAAGGGLAALVARYRAGVFTPLAIPAPSACSAPGSAATVGGCVPSSPSQEASTGRSALLRAFARAEQLLNQAERRGESVPDALFWTVAAGRGGKTGAVAIGDAAAGVAELERQGIAGGVLGQAVALDGITYKALGVGGAKTMCVAAGAAVDPKGIADGANVFLHAAHQVAGVVEEPVAAGREIGEDRRLVELGDNAGFAAFAADDGDGAGEAVQIGLAQAGNLGNAEACGAGEAGDQLGLWLVGQAGDDATSVVPGEAHTSGRAGDAGDQAVGYPRLAAGDPAEGTQSMLQLVEGGDGRANVAAAQALVLAVADVGLDLGWGDVAELADLGALLGNPADGRDAAIGVGGASLVGENATLGLAGQLGLVARAANAGDVIEGIVDLLDEGSSHGLLLPRSARFAPDSRQIQATYNPDTMGLMRDSAGTWSGSGPAPPDGGQRRTVSAETPLHVRSGRFSAPQCPI